MTDTIKLPPLPEPLSRLMKFAGKRRNEVSNPCFTARECIQMADQMHVHAAAVSAADNAALRGINTALCAKSNSYIVWNARLEERVKVLEDALRRCEASTTNDAVGQQARAALEFTHD